MPGTDPTHWLHRFDGAEWLMAAETELRHCEEALARRATRPAVAHARRAAGMAWNAVLTVRPDPLSGRSYMDHVVALCTDETAPPEVRAAAQLLRETPAAPAPLITLGKPDLRTLEAARRIIAYAHSRFVTLQTPPS
jgi:hypothetical protein